MEGQLHVASWSSEDSNELGTLNDHHTGAPPGDDAEDLRSDPYGGHDGLDDERRSRSELLGRPARNKEVDGPLLGQSCIQSLIWMQGGIPHMVVLMPRTLNCKAVPAVISSRLQRSPGPSKGGCLS